MPFIHSGTPKLISSLVLLNEEWRFIYIYLYIYIYTFTQIKGFIASYTRKDAANLLCVTLHVEVLLSNLKSFLVFFLWYLVFKNLLFGNFNHYKFQRRRFGFHITLWKIKWKKFVDKWVNFISDRQEQVAPKPPWQQSCPIGILLVLFVLESV